MGKKCCGCCGSGRSCCGCCCSKRGATATFAVIGLALAVAVIVPPVYVYAATEEQDFTQLFPVLELSKQFLERVAEDQKPDVVASGAGGGPDVVVVDDGGFMGGGGGGKVVDIDRDQVEEEQSASEKYRCVRTRTVFNVKVISMCTQG